MTWLPTFLSQSLELSGDDRSARNLLSLPNELLLQIFGYLHKDLLSLAIVSRRLHNLAFPIYLASHGLSNPLTELVVNAGHSDAVPLLQVSLSVKTLQHLSYTFRAYMAYTAFLRDIRRLDDFLSHLTSIRELTLDFVHINSSIWTLLNQNKCDFSSHLGFLLNTIIARRCTKLNLLRGTPVYDSLGYGRETDRSRLQAPSHNRAASLSVSGLWKRVMGGVAAKSPSPVLNVQQKSADEILRDFRTVRVSQAARLNTVLTTLKLHSPIFLVYPYRSWTIDVLNMSPITCLSFTVVGLSPWNWAGILPNLNMPLLRDVSFECCAIDPTHLFSFLSRHPLISKLYLNQTVHTTSDSISLSQNFLPHSLTTLSADPIGLVRFFTFVECAMPALHTVHILHSISQKDYFKYNQLRATLDPIIAQLSQVATLCLHISIQSCSTRWPLMDPCDLDPDVGRAPTALHEIKTLKILTKHLFSTHHPPSWLWLFPSLQRVSFNGLPDHRRNIATFLRRIQKSSPTIECVEINGVLHHTQYSDSELS